MIYIKEKTKCCGCGACMSICPQRCITLSRDKEGFSYPVVNSKLCIQCDACVRICPMLSLKLPKNEIPQTYAAYNLDDHVRRISSSGGIFTLLANIVLSHGGVVFGAAMMEDHHVRHIAVERENDLEQLRSSKYVQSIVGSAYSECKSILLSGREVLFTGTPCQIAGLKAFLHREYRTLYTQEVVCHGVPSPMIWEKYLALKEKKEKKQIDSICFRDKTTGWADYSVRYIYNDGKIELEPHNEDLYMKAFLQNLSLRPSCYQCPFKGGHTESDLTLGDFWGANAMLEQTDSRYGMSLVLCHTPQGRRLLQQIPSENMWITQVCYDDAVKYNQAIYQSSKEPGARTLLFHDLLGKPLDKCVDFCLSEAPQVVKLREFREDFAQVKSQKGLVYSLLWACKNIYKLL